MSYQYHTDLKAKATSKSSVISIKIDPKYADAVPQMTSKEYEDLDKQRELQDRIKRKVKTLSKREKKRKKQKEDFDGYRYGEDF